MAQILAGCFSFTSSIVAGSKPMMVLKMLKTCSTVRLGCCVLASVGHRGPIDKSMSMLASHGNTWDLSLKKTCHWPIAGSMLTKLRQFSTRNDLNQASPGEASIVYVGTLARMVRFIKLFSLSTSVVGISLQPYLYAHLQSLPPLLAAAVGGFFGFFIFMTPVILHVVTKRYVTSISLNHKTGQFSATTYTFFLREKHHQFLASDVKIPNTPGLFTTVRVNDNVPLFIDPDLFTDRNAMLKLLKYDEPLDWEIDVEKKQQEQQQQTKF